MNFMCWIKPQAADVDAIEKLGNPGWNWKDYAKYTHFAETWVHLKFFELILPILPLSLSSRGHPAAKEQTDVFPHHYNPEYHGTSGPIQTMTPFCIHTIDHLVRDTLVNAGMKVVEDPYGGDVGKSWTYTAKYGILTRVLDQRSLDLCCDNGSENMDTVICSQCLLSTK